MINPLNSVRVRVFNATFNNISVISWWSVLLVEETGVPRENHWPSRRSDKFYLSVYDCLILTLNWICLSIIFHIWLRTTIKCTFVQFQNSFGLHLTNKLLFWCYFNQLLFWIFQYFKKYVIILYFWSIKCFADQNFIFI